MFLYNFYMLLAIDYGKQLRIYPEQVYYRSKLNWISWIFVEPFIFTTKRVGKFGYKNNSIVFIYLNTILFYILNYLCAILSLIWRLNNIFVSKTTIHYLVVTPLLVISFAVCLYRVSNFYWYTSIQNLSFIFF